jgi:hypothetical protein
MLNEIKIILALIVAVYSANCPATLATGGCSSVVNGMGSVCETHYYLVMNTTTNEVTTPAIACRANGGAYCIDGPSCEMDCGFNSLKTGYPVPITQTCAGFSQSVCMPRIGYDNGFDQWWCYWNTVHNNCQKSVICHI